MQNSASRDEVLPTESACRAHAPLEHEQDRMQPDYSELRSKNGTYGLPSPADSQQQQLSGKWSGSC